MTFAVCPCKQTCNDYRQGTLCSTQQSTKGLVDLPVSFYGNYDDGGADDGDNGEDDEDDDDGNDAVLVAGRRQRFVQFR